MTTMPAIPSPVAGVDAVYGKAMGTGLLLPEFVSPTCCGHVSKDPWRSSLRSPSMILTPTMLRGDSMILTMLSASVCCVYALTSLAMTGYWAWRVWIK